MINLVRMEQVGDCGPACLAMVLGKTLAEVTKAFPMRGDIGLDEDDMIAYLGGHGVPAISSLTIPDSRIPAILTVPSLNHPGLLHYVVWDGARLLDPSHEEKRYPDDLKTYCRPDIGAFWATAILLWPTLPDSGAVSTHTFNDFYDAHKDEILHLFFAIGHALDAAEPSQSSVAAMAALRMGARLMRLAHPHIKLWEFINACRCAWEQE